MTKISSTYQGKLRCSSEHLKSGSLLLTDAPIDNHGKGEAFSPTDLLATSLITCMLTVMGIRAEKLGLNMSGSHGEVIKSMRSSPRAVDHLEVELHLHGIEKQEHKDILEEVGIKCPVALSLDPAVKQTYSFVYPTSS